MRETVEMAVIRAALFGGLTTGMSAFLLFLWDLKWPAVKGKHVKDSEGFLDYYVRFLCCIWFCATALFLYANHRR
jgi:hypothetical protein